MSEPKKNVGFAAMSKEQQVAIAKKGGKAVSKNKEHMAEIGRKGGINSGSVRSKISVKPKEEGVE